MNGAKGFVNVLRRLLMALVPGGVVVDLTMSPPDELVESGGEVLGRLDGSLFFPRALAACAGLDTLAGERVLSFVREEPVSVIVRYPTGADSSNTWRIATTPACRRSSRASSRA